MLEISEYSNQNTTFFLTLTCMDLRLICVHVVKVIGTWSAPGKSWYITKPLCTKRWTEFARHDVA